MSKSNNDDNDPRKTIPNNFGDVMSSKATTLLLPDEFSGLERICLTANGNLQRILSSWFNKTVTVEIIKNDPVNIETDLQSKIMIMNNTKISNDFNGIQIFKRFDREVNIICENKIVCNAKSDVVIKDYNIARLIEHNGVGIGQLFRYLDKLPSFQLHYIGRTNKVWWREYTLHISGVNCHIKETFPNNMFDNDWLNNDDDNNNGLMNDYDNEHNEHNDNPKVWKLE